MSEFLSLVKNRGHRRHFIPWAACFLIPLLVLLPSAASAGPSGDYGDAPVGDAVDNIEAYPGVLSRFVSYYNHTNTVFMPMHDHGTYVNSGAEFQLGVIAPSIKTDTQQDPALPENDCYPLILLEGTHPTPGPNPLASFAIDITTTASHNPDDTLFINVFVDQNRDGQWKDGYLFGTQVFTWNKEWAFEDFAVFQGADQTVLHTLSFFRMANPTEDVWVRVIVSNERIGAKYRDNPPVGIGMWDATMPSTVTATGEVEDFLLSYYSNPMAMPTTGSRPYGIVLRRFLQPNPPPGAPKPDCFLFFAKATYPRPPFDLRRRVILTPACADGGVDFGLSFTTANLNGGCDNADALVGIYGYKLVEGRGMEPIVTQTGAPPGLAAPPLVCPPAGPNLTLPGAHPDDPINFTKDEEGVAPVTNWRAGTKFFNACYPDPPRYRRYASKLIAKACGSEIANHTAVPGYDDPYNYTVPQSTLGPHPGQNAEVHFVHGGLWEKFEDPDEPVPFPDPDFTAFSFYTTQPSGFADLVTDDFNSAPSSARLFNGGYEVSPMIPEETIPEAVEFWYKGIGGTYTILGTGDPLVGTLPEAESWTEFSIPLPAEYIPEFIQFEFLDGYLDDIFLPLTGYSPDEAQPYQDCNDNGTPDDQDIEDGFSEDANGNFIPDECDGYVPPAGCGDANGDTNVNISDAVYVINYVFIGGDPPDPLSSGDVNCDGTVNVSDAVWIINFIFIGGNDPCDTDGDGVPDC
ncbi:MAG: hypothetical protein GF310_11025 [candidate division Zixibacteria bacterium]|nr:hypothetical protein [candidate division Zixibacteria bacterium]